MRCPSVSSPVTPSSEFRVLRCRYRGCWSKLKISIPSGRSRLGKGGLCVRACGWLVNPPIPASSRVYNLPDPVVSVSVPLTCHSHPPPPPPRPPRDPISVRSVRESGRSAVRRSPRFEVEIEARMLGMVRSGAGLGTHFWGGGGDRGGARIEIGFELGSGLDLICCEGGGRGAWDLVRMLVVDGGGRHSEGCAQAQAQIGCNPSTRTRLERLSCSMRARHDDNVEDVESDM